MISEHFDYVWRHDRTPPLQQDEFMATLPFTLKQALIVHFVYDDVFATFKRFFRTEKFRDSPFLQDIAYGLKPRFFSAEEDKNVVYNEGEEIQEMYFVLKGQLKAGYSKY